MIAQWKPKIRAMFVLTHSHSDSCVGGIWFYSRATNEPLNEQQIGYPAKPSQPGIKSLKGNSGGGKGNGLKIAAGRGKDFMSAAGVARNFFLGDTLAGSDSERASRADSVGVKLIDRLVCAELFARPNSRRIGREARFALTGSRANLGCR